MSTFVSFLSLADKPWCLQDELLLPKLPPIRQAVVKEYVSDADQRLSMYAVLLLSYMLEIHFHITNSLDDIRWEHGKKPFLASFSHIDFNYSHTRHAILCGISSTGSIGVDLERLHKAPFEIMPLVFHPEEISYVESFSSSDKTRAFFEIWTRKEAYTKRKGIGLCCDLTTINTLSLSLASFKKWEQESYICTTCLESLHPISFEIIHEDIITSYMPHSKLCF